MFKVTTSCLSACTQPYYPLVNNGFVDDAVRDARPRVNDALLQVAGVADGRLVHAIASNPRSASRPGLGADWPQIGGDELRCLLLQVAR